jgi:cellulose biosynthesis protein BcsQ
MFWMLAHKGSKVIIVDCDPQCNQTGMVLGFKDSLEFESRPTTIGQVTCQSVEGQPNMYLLPRHIGLAEYEVTLGIAQELSGSLVTLQNLPGPLSHLFDITAKNIRLISTLDKSDKELDELWIREAEDRIDAYDQGKIKAISVENVLQKYR